MADKPIIMSGESVRAIMAGLKRQTRRLVRGWPNSGTSEWQLLGCHDGVAAFRSFGERLEIRAPCQPGDTLWVKETWARCQTIGRVKRLDGRSYSEASGGFAGYKADGHESVEDLRAHIRLMNGLGCESVEIQSDRWQSPLFMPKWASRLSLLVTEVRAQRVQDISAADIEAEGITLEGNYRARFRDHWDRINGKKHPWASNPWVFAYTFEWRKGGER